MMAERPAPQVTISQAGQVVRSVIWGQPVYFTITNSRDHIQKMHRQGSFYEREELEIIRRNFVPGSVFCDIGANIGNHSLFVLKFLFASRAILFEPNPAAISILRSNLQLNGVEEMCDLTHLGIGLSDSTAEGMAVKALPRNLGAGRLVEGAGDIAVRCGDDVLGDTSVDFIKIDVEGMEMAVLRGLSGVVKAQRPTFFVEVDDANQTELAAWVQDNAYAVQAKYRRYRSNRNYLIVPKPAPRAKSQNVG
jgi:FkbM family methyltransferase